MSPTQGSRCASTLGYGRFPLQGMAWADVGLCSSRDVLRSNADGVPIQGDGLPIGAGVFRGMSSGADTEVRPPATRGLGPFGAWYGGRGLELSMQGGWWPRGRFSFDPCPAERTQRSAPPPPGCWVHWARCGDGRGLGVSDPGFLAAHGIGFRSIQVQRSGHGGPPPRHPRTIKGVILKRSSHLCLSPEGSASPGPGWPPRRAG